MTTRTGLPGNCWARTAAGASSAEARNALQTPASMGLVLLSAAPGSESGWRCHTGQSRESHKIAYTAINQRRPEMPFYEKGKVRIYYEEAGSGFPLMLIAGGGLNSTIDRYFTGDHAP